MSRASMLEHIRRRLGVSAADHERRELALARMTSHAANTIPGRARLSGEARIEEFMEMLQRVQGTVARIDEMAAVPRAVEDYLGNGAVCLSQEVIEMSLPWQDTELRLVPWSARTSFDVCVTACMAAAAETGTLVVRSSPLTPLTQHFLGETHIAILKLSQLHGAYEDVWPMVRDAMPRHLTFVSGPSCTGDIEMVMEYGAHGPRRLHVILVEETSV